MSVTFIFYVDCYQNSNFRTPTQRILENKKQLTYLNVTSKDYFFDSEIFYLAQIYKENG